MIINGIEYEFDIVLSNGDGSITLPKTLFKELNIEESFDDWGFSGYMIYDNSFEQLERYKAKANVKNSEFFYFRMDGTDEISINLTPVNIAETNKSKKVLKDFPVEIMSLTFRGSVYDTEDLSKADISNKLKKLYFWDYYYNKAMVLNQRVSSGDYLTDQNFSAKDQTPKDVALLDNDSRSILNGDLLKYICQSKLGADVDDITWNSGARTSFYVSAPSSTVANDMDYLINGYSDVDGYPAYFDYCRKCQSFRLESYRDLFTRYDTDIKERFHFTDPTKPTSGVVPARGATDNIFSIPSFSEILTYKYSKMAGSDNMMELNSRSISGYDRLNKRFITASSMGNIQNVKAKYAELLNGFPVGNQNPLFITNESKNRNEGLIEDYALERLSVARETLKSALLLNDSVYFECLGLPNRSDGHFIEIQSDTDTEGIWEDRFLGTWLTMAVTHNIKDNVYKNQILAVKPNMSESFKFPDGTEVAKQNVETLPRT